MQLQKSCNLLDEDILRATFPNGNAFVVLVCCNRSTVEQIPDCVRFDVLSGDRRQTTDKRQKSDEEYILTLTNRLVPWCTYATIQLVQYASEDVEV